MINTRQESGKPGTGHGSAGVMRALNRQHITVPHHMSVVGFLDPDWFDSVQPRITCYRLPLDHMGTAAAALLVERLNNQPTHHPQHITITGELIVRESTAPPRPNAQP